MTDFAVHFPAPDGPYVLDGEVLRAPSVRVQAGPQPRPGGRGDRGLDLRPDVPADAGEDVGREAFAERGLDLVLADFEAHDGRELELAFGHDVTQNPEQKIAVWGPALRRYLTDHIHPTTLNGQAWSVRAGDMTVGESEQIQSGAFQRSHSQPASPTWSG